MMINKWIVRVGALLVFLGYFLPSVTVSCAALPDIGETYSLSRASGDSTLLYLIPLGVIGAFVLGFLVPKTRNQVMVLFWGQVVGAGIGIVAMLLSLVSLSGEIQQYGLKITPEIGFFVLVFGYILMGVGFVMNWLEGDFMKLLASMSGSIGDRASPMISPPADTPQLLPSTHIEIIQGSQAGSVIPVEKEDFAIGRASHNDLVVSDPAVSRDHAHICYAQGLWFIQDRESKGGIFVNGQSIYATRLDSGDKITIGDTTFLIRFG